MDFHFHGDAIAYGTAGRWGIDAASCTLEPFKHSTTIGLVFSRRIIDLNAPPTNASRVHLFIGAADSHLRQTLAGALSVIADIGGQALYFSFSKFPKSQNFEDMELVQLFRETEHIGNACIYAIQQVDHGRWQKSFPEAIDFLHREAVAVK
jgi:hypothetical protein